MFLKPKMISPHLPLLDAMLNVINTAGAPKLQNVALIGVQHMLYTTASLIDALIQLGLKPGNLHLLGKNYSNCPLVINYLSSIGIKCYSGEVQKSIGGFNQSFQKNVSQLWENFLADFEKKKYQALIILDDGGNCLEFFPNELANKLPIIGVEQTTNGIKNLAIKDLPFPIIEVASSAAKKYLESPLIADAIIEKLNNIFPLLDPKKTCGVIGMGVIGQAVTKKLISLGFLVHTYDNCEEKNISVDNSIVTEDIENVISASDYVFGCAGVDVTESLNFEKIINRDKFFISCSSKDIEFLSLLKWIDTYSPHKQVDVLNTIECKITHFTVKIFRGGFPINLDNSGESVPTEKIQLTRALLFGGIIQGILSMTKRIRKNISKRYMLDPLIQKFIVLNWNKYQIEHVFSDKLIHHFYDTHWIEDHSGGLYHPCDFVARRFNPPQPLLLQTENKHNFKHLITAQSL